MEVMMAADLERVKLLREIKARNNPPLTEKEKKELEFLEAKLAEARKGSKR